MKGSRAWHGATAQKRRAFVRSRYHSRRVGPNSQNARAVVPRAVGIGGRDIFKLIPDPNSRHEHFCLDPGTKTRQIS